jgi:hypothetical protein
MIMFIVQAATLRRRAKAGAAMALTAFCSSAFLQASAEPPSTVCQVLTPGSPPDAPAVVPGALQLIWADAPQSSPGLPPRPGSAQVLYPQAPPGVPPDLVSGTGLVVLTPGVPPGMAPFAPGSLKVITPPIAPGKC